MLFAPSFNVNVVPAETGASFTLLLLITTKVDLLSSSFAFANL